VIKPGLLTGGGSLVPEADSRIALRRAGQDAAPKLHPIRLELVSVALNGGWQCGLGWRAWHRLAATATASRLRRAVDLTHARWNRTSVFNARVTDMAYGVVGLDGH